MKFLDRAFDWADSASSEGKFAIRALLVGLLGAVPLTGATLAVLGLTVLAFPWGVLLPIGLLAWLIWWAVRE
jgi:hypothetical protein